MYSAKQYSNGSTSMPHFSNLGLVEIAVFCSTNETWPNQMQIKKKEAEEQEGTHELFSLNWVFDCESLYKCPRRMATPISDKLLLGFSLFKFTSCVTALHHETKTHPCLNKIPVFGWDEIEDLSNIDEKKVTHARSPNRAYLRKRLSVVEEEEDLSWDIEDVGQRDF
ncbi:hypothetical protein Pint_19824 [Pistacia integerrima]|uniref:Uncharacterized protein n=1 Tax=Pistacia integerrima TaxID=434235 RepID=A0ACC0XCH9_9ROSI|nr:hypothetical protein Pint_19824 [Pistacia integerrima]